METAFVVPNTDAKDFSPPNTTVPSVRISFAENFLNPVLKYSNDIDTQGCTGESMYPMKTELYIIANTGTVKADAEYFAIKIGKIIETGS